MTHIVILGSFWNSTMIKVATSDNIGYMTLTGSLRLVWCF